MTDLRIPHTMTDEEIRQTYARLADKFHRKHAEKLDPAAMAQAEKLARMLLDVFTEPSFLSYIAAMSSLDEVSRIRLLLATQAVLGAPVTRDELLERAAAARLLLDDDEAEARDAMLRDETS